jgi:hypothetical protein
MCLAVVNITRAQTIANPKRTKYSRRKADAVVERLGSVAAGAVVVVIVILSVVREPRPGDGAAVTTSAGAR